MFMKSPLEYENLIEERLGKQNVNHRETHYIIGEAFHLRTLQQNVYVKDVIISDFKTRKGKGFAELCEENRTNIVLTETEDFAINEMALSVTYPGRLNLHCAKNIIEGAKVEQSYYWRDEETGILLKCRPDIVKDNILCDLKSARKGGAEPSAFSKAIATYGYDIQAAWYLDGANAIEDGRFDEFLFIVVEKEPPYLCAVYFLGQDSITIGREKYRRALKRFVNYDPEKDCKTYSPNIMPIELPAWAINQHYNRIGE